MRPALLRLVSSALVLSFICTSCVLSAHDRGQPLQAVGSGAASSSRSHAMRGEAAQETGLEEKLATALHASSLKQNTSLEEGNNSERIRRAVERLTALSEVIHAVSQPGRGGGRATLARTVRRAVADGSDLQERLHPEDGSFFADEYLYVIAGSVYQAERVSLLDRAFEISLVQYLLGSLRDEGVTTYSSLQVADVARSLWEGLQTGQTGVEPRPGITRDQVEGLVQRLFSVAGISRSAGLEEKTGYVVVGGMAALIPPNVQGVYAVTVGFKQTKAVLNLNRVPPSHILAVATGLEEVATLEALGIPAQNIVRGWTFTNLETAKDFSVGLAKRWLTVLDGVRVSVLETTARTVQALLAQLQALLPAVWQQSITAEDAELVRRLNQTGV